MRHDLSSQEVFVFTPKGEVIALPNGSTPVDFAYAVHTEVGHRCIGARVNSKLVPLESALSNGDVVEILTSKSETAGPTQDWLGFVKSSRARTKIRQYFNKESTDARPRDRSQPTGHELRNLSTGPVARSRMCPRHRYGWRGGAAITGASGG